MPLTASTAAAAAVEAAEAGAAVAAAASSGGGSQSLPNTPQTSEMPNLTPGKERFLKMLIYLRLVIRFADNWPDKMT